MDTYLGYELHVSICSTHTIFQTTTDPWGITVVAKLSKQKPLPVLLNHNSQQVACLLYIL